MGEVEMARKSRKVQPSQRRKVIYIAFEGSKTERKYFDGVIKQHNMRNIRLLTKKNTRSSPSDVIKRLDIQKGTRKQVHAVELEEEFWAVFDTDRRPTELLSRVAEEAKLKNYFVADSIPCFEVWLVQHFNSLRNLSGFAGDAEVGGCDRVIGFLRKRFDPTYHKSKYDVSKYVDRLDNAICNAEKDDTEKHEAMFSTTGSRVYKLAQSIIDSSPNNPGN